MLNVSVVKAECLLILNLQMHSFVMSSVKAAMTQQYPKFASRCSLSFLGAP